MFGWIPIIGPIIDGIVSIFIKSKDVQLQKYKTAADVRKVEVQASTDTVIAFKSAIDIRIARDLVLYPISIHTALIIWDKIVVIRYPGLVWGVSPLTEQTGLAFLPYAAMVFLFGLVAVDQWRR